MLEAIIGLYGIILGSNYMITLSLIVHLITTWKKRKTINKKRLIITTIIYSIMTIFFLHSTFISFIILPLPAPIIPDGTTQKYIDIRNWYIDIRNWYSSITVGIEVIIILFNKYFKYKRAESENKEEIKKIMFYYLLGVLIYILFVIIQRLFV